MAIKEEVKKMHFQNDPVPSLFLFFFLVRLRSSSDDSLPFVASFWLSFDELLLLFTSKPSTFSAFLFVFDAYARISFSMFCT